MERPPEPETRRASNAGSAKSRGAAPQRTAAAPLPQFDRLKLAETATKLNVRVRSSDMPPSMQERAIRRATESIGSDPHKTRKLSPTKLAMSLKKEFDGAYGPAWHCIVGKSFGSFVTHATGGFLYFSVDNLCFLLFKTRVRPVSHKS